ncbi:MAG TPA: hypothetical protein V6C97_33395 [Oculatellaceae cyanobacterium]
MQHIEEPTKEYTRQTTELQSRDTQREESASGAAQLLRKQKPECKNDCCKNCVEYNRNAKALLHLSHAASCRMHNETETQEQPCRNASGNSRTMRASSEQMLREDRHMLRTQCGVERTTKASAVAKP